MPSKETRAERIAAGLCWQCGEKARKGKKTCTVCGDKQLEACKRYQAGKAAKAGAAIAGAKSADPDKFFDSPQMVLSSAEIATLPAGARNVVRCWFELRRRMFKALKGEHRLMAKTMLGAMRTAERKVGAKPR